MVLLRTAETYQPIWNGGSGYFQDSNLGSDYAKIGDGM